MPTVLLTGGTGYIGSHACVEFINAGFETVLFDNLCNSSPAVVDRIVRITGKRPAFIQGDVRDRVALDRVFGKHLFDAVVHFAGLKAVGDSMSHPLEYYINNVGGSATLLEAMQHHGVRTIAFSSSATVYGTVAQMPIAETIPTGPVNPYGHSKLMIEQMLHDLALADPSWRVLCLRYFNPVGAHASGTMGEDPRGVPNNLMPYVAQVAAGRLPQLRIFGSDYPTPDGTGLRDYIHVSDLAAGHVAAVNRLVAREPVPRVMNLGTGRGHSVLEVVRAFEHATGRSIPYLIVDRRPGDAAVSYADPTLAHRVLGWTACRDLTQMCADTWRWQLANPYGYADH
jgi:UDP-glucose 4-epimerase